MQKYRSMPKALHDLVFSDGLTEIIYKIALENNFDEETFLALEDLIHLLIIDLRTKEQVRAGLKEYLSLPEITVVKIMSRIEGDILSVSEIKTGLLGRLMNKTG